MPVSSEPDGSTAATTQPPRPRTRDAIPIHHLLNSPPGDDFVGHFPIRDVAITGTIEDETTSLADGEDVSEASQWSEEPEVYDPYLGAPDPAFESFFDGLENMTFGHPAVLRGDHIAPTSHPGLMVLSTQAQALEPRAAEVRQALQVTAATFGNTYPECQHMLELGPAIEQLTGAECDSLIDMYFENYHRHCPLIHRPTFQPTQCPLALLLSIMALGGMYAPSPDIVHRMRSLLDVIECHIYSLPGLRDEFNDSLDLSVASDEFTLWHQFETFQGAYLIIVAQYFSGNLGARRRARRQRFTRVLDIARSFKLPTSQHSPFLSIPDEQAFTSWIRTETRIRQMNIMMALDAAMAIFNNLPPRVSFSELDLQLPCDPVYFELSSYAEVLARSLFPKPKMKLVEAFQKLFVEPSALNTVYEKDLFNCWDMLLLAHCLYTHVWRQIYANPLLRSSPSTLYAPSTILEPLKSAIRNWKTIWDDIRCSLSREQIKEMGFETSADSYWTLTKLIVQRFEGKHPLNGSHSASSSTTSNPITPVTGAESMNLNIVGHSTAIKQETVAQGQFAVPGSYVSVGIGNALPINSYPMGYAGAIQSGMHGYSAPSMGMVAPPPPPPPAQFMTPQYSNGQAAPMTTQEGSTMPPPPQGHQALDFMPIETDFDSQGQHLRKILKRGR